MHACMTVDPCLAHLIQRRPVLRAPQVLCVCVMCVCVCVCMHPCMHQPAEQSETPLLLHTPTQEQRRRHTFLRHFCHGHRPGPCASHAGLATHAPRCDPSFGYTRPHPTGRRWREAIPGPLAAVRTFGRRPLPTAPTTPDTPACMYTRIHACMHACSAYVRACVCVRVRACVCVCACACACVRVCAWVCISADDARRTWQTATSGHVRQPRQVVTAVPSDLYSFISQLRARAAASP